MGDRAGDEIPQEILDWARREFDQEAFIAGLREIQETGGLELKDFIHELEANAAPDRSITRGNHVNRAAQNRRA